MIRTAPTNLKTGPAPGIYDMAAIGDAVMSPEIEERLKALCLVPPKETEARFKLELFLLRTGVAGEDSRGVISAWTNGGHLNGGGDQSVYFCPQQVETASGYRTCLAPVDVRFTVNNRAVCTACQRVTHTRDLCGQVVATASTQRWANLLERFFAALEFSADVRLCVEQQSLRRASEAETERNRGGDVYDSVYKTRSSWIVYPLAGILKDTATGATLNRRLKAFLEA